MKQIFHMGLLGGMVTVQIDTSLTFRKLCLLEVIDNLKTSARYQFSVIHSMTQRKYVRLKFLQKKYYYYYFRPIAPI